MSGRAKKKIRTGARRPDAPSPLTARGRESRPAETPAGPAKQRRPYLYAAGAAAFLAAGFGAFLLLRIGGWEPLDGNILVISLDTTRADVLTANGGTGNHTPNLDRLVREGVLFKNCLSHVPLTLPSHITLFTGRTPLAHQVRNNGRYALPPRETTLAERLKPAGFRTYAVISSYVLLGRFGLNQGFDEYDDSLDSYKAVNSYNSEIPADVVSGRFRKWLNRHKDERFFAWVHFYDPHEPYTPPPPFQPGPDEAKNPRSRYLGEVAFMDREIGRILDELKTRGVADKTLIVIVGDHGEAFGEHLEYGHVFFCYEPNIRVPLIFHHPARLPQNRAVEDPVGLVDVMPTLLELAGREEGEGLQGRSLVPYLRPKAGSLPPRPFYLESLYGAEENGWAPLTGLVENGMKFISLPRMELYDLRADPAESRNLFDEKPAVARRMRDALAAYIAAHTDAKSSAKRDLTADDVRQLQALGYLASTSTGTATHMDPKDGMAFQIRLDEFYKDLEKDPGSDLESAVDRFYRENRLARNQSLYSRVIRIYEQRKRADKVVGVLLRTIDEFPDYVGGRMHLLRTYILQREYAKAVTAGRDILELDPINSNAYILMGDAYAALGETENARSCLQSALNIEPENVSLRLKLAETLIARGNDLEALKAYDVLIAEEDILNDAGVLYKIALFYAKNGRTRTAADLMDRCCRLEPSGERCYLLGLLRFRLEDYEGAVKAMRTALQDHGSELTPGQRAQAEKLIGS